MKKLIVAAALVGWMVLPPAVYADTVQTCENVYGGGEVCGSSTSPVVNTAMPSDQVAELAAGIVALAIVATVLYKISYRWYILG